ncbi:MAG: YigZ family protein [Bacteroidales bacterium]|nr:YigZ family protein [Bacteroidales bacterium]MCF8458310.1 YigZ family protein [Bacteroidales bacterium]
MPTDTYKTIAAPSEGNFKDRGSKFPSFAFPVYSEEEIKEILQDLRKKYYDARHHCYAWRLGADMEHYRTNDDGEPSSTAGKPILGQIQSNGLSNILIVVIRYFGGTKLGVPGLINAYRTAAADALSNAEFVEKTVNDILRVDFDYLAMNDVMKIMKEDQPLQIDQQFDLKCSITLSIRQSESERLTGKFEEIDTVKVEYLRTE